MPFDDVKVVFFDIDNTLFDHRAAEQTALRQLRQAIPELQRLPEADLLREYDRINTLLWRQLADGQITAEQLKTERFAQLLDHFGLDHAPTPEAVAARYVEFYRQVRVYLPGAAEILDYLRPKYELGVLSNGFPELQEAKLAGLPPARGIKYRIYSAAVGALKPAREIFAAAERACGRPPRELVYVGDAYDSDIIGAKQAGWLTVWLNRDLQHEADGVADAQIRRLIDIEQIL